MPAAAAPRPPGDEPASKSALVIMGQRLAGHSALYAVASAMGFFFTLVQFAVLTRLLPKESFGALALLVLLGTAITTVCNLALVQGSIISIFQGGDEDEVSEQPDRFGVDARGVLSTGFFAVVLLGVVVVGALALFGPQASRAYLGDDSAPAAIAWGAAGGVIGSLWRLVSAIPRFERRPVLYLGLNLLRHLAAIGVAVVLVEVAGLGLTGAIAGLVLGRAAILLVGVFVARHRFRLGFQPAYVRKVFRQGRPFIVLTGAFFVSRNVDLLVLAQFVDNGELAAYLVATRLGMVPSFAMSAALFAWGPLLRGPLRAALEKQQAIDVARSRLVGYFLLLAMWVVVGSVLLAEVVIRIAPAEYADAGELVPLLTVAAALHGLMMMVYRMSRFDRKLRKLKQVAVFSAVFMTVGTLLFVPSAGATGAALTAVAAPLIGASVMLFYSQRRGSPLIFDRRQVLGCLTVAGFLVTGGLLARPLAPGPELAVDAVLLLLYPLLLLFTGALPRHQVQRLLGAFGLVRAARAERRETELRLRELPRADVELLEALIRRRESPASVGERLGETEKEVIRHMVLVLRGLAGVPVRSVVESKLGRYLLSRASRTQRDRAGYILSLSTQVDALDLERLTVLYDRLAKLPAGAWEAARGPSGEVDADALESATPPAGQAAPSSR